MRIVYERTGCVSGPEIETVLARVRQLTNHIKGQAATLERDNRNLNACSERIKLAAAYIYGDACVLREVASSLYDLAAELAVSDE